MLAHCLSNTAMNCVITKNRLDHTRNFRTPLNVFQAYQAELVSVNSAEEHGFLVNELLWQDPQHRRWYTSARQQSPDYWINGDNSQLVNMDNAFLPEHRSTFNKDYLVYR